MSIINNFKDAIMDLMASNSYEIIKQLFLKNGIPIYESLQIIMEWFYETGYESELKDVLNFSEFLLDYIHDGETAQKYLNAFLNGFYVVNYDYDPLCSSDITNLIRKLQNLGANGILQENHIIVLPPDLFFEYINDQPLNVTFELLLKCLKHSNNKIITFIIDEIHDYQYSVDEIFQMIINYNKNLFVNDAITNYLKGLINDDHQIYDSIIIYYSYYIHGHDKMMNYVPCDYKLDLYLSLLIRDSNMEKYKSDDIIQHDKKPNDFFSLIPKNNGSKIYDLELIRNKIKSLLDQ